MIRGQEGGISMGMALISLLTITVVIASCQSNRTSRSQPMNPTIAEAPISCRAIAIASGDAIYSLRFELSNSGAETLEASTYEPFTAFTVIGTAGNKPLTVYQPMLDIPVRPIIIRVPPKTTVTVATPIQLRISEGAGPGTDGFLWTIPHDRKSVSLQVKLELPGSFGVVGPIVFQ
jgi:hypothetical protein